MEPRLWSRDLASHARIICRFLPSIKVKENIDVRRCSSLTEKYSNDCQSESGEVSCDERKGRFGLKSWCKQKHLNYLKLHSIHDNARTGKENEVNKLLSSLMLLDSKAHDFVGREGGKASLRSLLAYKTYLNLKEKDLISVDSSSPRGWDSRCSPLQFHITSSTRADGDISSGISWDNGDVLDFMAGSSPESMTDKLRTSMSERYREPSEETVKRLQALFPEPAKTFQDVMHPVKDAGLLCHEPMAVSSHMKGFYWKAKIRLLWPRTVTVTGVHVVKEEAITRAYLAVCAQLMELGLLVHGHNSIQPVSCDSVVERLEQISDYGDSVIVSSRGKGFKIVLENINRNSEDSDENLCYNRINGKICGEWRVCHNNNNNDARSKWSCCVHVGWPVPFSVSMLAPSLPSAQMLALMTVACNLKMLNLLRREDTGVINSAALQKAVMIETKKEWHKCCKTFLIYCDVDNHRDSDAKIYVDASRVGYGAYLQLKDSDKVRWLSEPWLNQPQVASQIYYYYNRKIHYNCVKAELFALVSSVFSWKRKLQHCKLVCHSDSQTTVALISALKHTQPSTSHSNKYISACDYLTDTLQKTCQTYSIQLQAVWVQRHRNHLADSLANGHIHDFKAAVTNAEAGKTKVKHLQFKNRVHSQAL